MEKRHAFGKGLSALIPDAAEALATPRVSLEADIDQLEPNHYQPRGPIDAARARRPRRVDRGQRDHSADRGARAWTTRSADAIVIRSSPANGAGGPLSGPGSRASRSSSKTCPPPNGSASSKWRSIENIQREDLNPMEAAAAYQRLADEFHLRQEEIATEVGKDRATVANYLRLLKLPEEVRGNVASGALSMGHARAIVALAAESDQRRLARDVVSRGLSVRETEALVRRRSATKPRRRETGSASSPGRTCTRAPPRTSCECRSARRSRSNARVKAGRSR